ncbi:MAG: GNAT family N-acetyltransferase [Planctomycetota bacterium]
MTRLLKPDDLPAVKAIITACELFPPELLDEMVTPFFAAEPCQEFWLVSGEPDAVAVAYCAQERMIEGTWNLLLLAVHPDHQAKGLDTELTSQAEQVLSEQGERLLLVETSGTDDFAQARDFYRQRGYEKEARLRDYYEAGDDKIVFRKTLA